MIAAISQNLGHKKPLVACLAVLEELDKKSSVKNNLCQGSDGIGFALPHIPCEQLPLKQQIFEENTAGSCEIGFNYNKVPGQCMAATGAKAFACKIGQMANPP